MKRLRILIEEELDEALAREARATGTSKGGLLRADAREKLAADGRVLHAGTYNANTVAVAAANASLQLLSQPGTYERLFALSGRLTDGMAGTSDRAGIPVRIQGVGPMFQLWFSDRPIWEYRDAQAHLDSPNYAALARALHERGVLVHPSNIELRFVSTAHTDHDIDSTLSAFSDAVTACRPILARRPPA